MPGEYEKENLCKKFLLFAYYYTGICDEFVMRLKKT